MSYDATIDCVLVSSVIENGTTQLVVNLVQYGEGDKKIALNRYYQDKKTKSWKFTKLGRLTLSEALAVANIIRKYQAENLFVGEDVETLVFRYNVPVTPAVEED